MITRAGVVALVLGACLALGALALRVGWQETYVHGSEQCGRCLAERTVERRGPSWSRSEPTRRAKPDVTACATHEWRRTGCWQVEGAFARCGAPRVE